MKIFLEMTAWWRLVPIVSLQMIFTRHLKIGDNSIPGEGAKIYGHNHEYENNGIPYRDQGFKSEEVIKGNNCWIGSNVTILAGVHIGDNSVIEANCLVYKGIPDNNLVRHIEELLITYSGCTNAT